MSQVAVGSDVAESRVGVTPDGPRHFPWPAVLCVAVYAGLALGAYWPAWPGDPHRFIACACGDPSEAVWFLAWIPHAIFHGENPFFTTVINHPGGINLAVNTGMPLLGFLSAPLTLVFGPVSSFTFLMWLAFPLSASSLFFVLRRWTNWYPAAFLGGLLYGFSPYIVGQGRLHLQLVFVPLPPIIALAVVELFAHPGRRPLRWGVVLGGTVVAQYLISTEILASTGLVVVIALVVLGVSHPKVIWPTVRAVAPALGVAGLIVVVFLAYPAGMVLAGPQRYSVPTWALDLVDGRSGPLGAVAPTTSMLVAPHGLTQAGSSVPGFSDTVENGSYLGVPLLALVLYLVVRFRRNRWMGFTLLMAVASYLLTLGPHLDLGSDRTSIPLPFAVLVRVPLVGLINPIRMSLYVVLFVSIALALGLDQLVATWSGRSAPPTSGGPSAERRTRLRRTEVGLVALVGAASLVSLLPRWPVGTTTTAVPSYFTSSAVDRIQPGSTVLTYPYPVPGGTEAMLWQAITGMRFDLLGSYALHPSPQGYAAQFPSLLRPFDVQRFLYGEQGVHPETGSPFPVGSPDPLLVADVRRFVSDNSVDTVLVARSAPHAAMVTGVLTRALGAPSSQSGQIDAWYDVPERVGPPSSATPG